MTDLGKSAGRSRNSPTRPTARRRFDDIEREQATRLIDDPQAWPTMEDVSKPTNSEVLRMFRYFVFFFGGLLVGQDSTVMGFIGVMMILATVFITVIGRERRGTSS
jgi:hypothetical protein